MLGLDSRTAREYAENFNIGAGSGCTEATDESYETAIDATVVVAMYSTMNDTEANARASSVRDMMAYVRRGDMDNSRVLDLLNNIAPEASIGEREKAASRLASILEADDGELTPQQSMQAANELTRLITGDEVDSEQRMEAAREMVRLSKSGDLNADNASELMDTIAPEWSIAERKEALGYLAWQYAHGDWDADSAKRTAEEGYTLITGGEIQLEKRMEAGVELVGEGLKRYGGESYDDESVDKATELIKAAIDGELSTSKVSSILDADKSSTYANSGQNASEKAERHRRIYDRTYAIVTEYDGWPSSFYGWKRSHSIDEDDRDEDYRRFARSYANAIVYDEKSPRYALYYAHAFHFSTSSGEAHARAKVEVDAYNSAYANQIRAGRSSTYAHEYAESLISGGFDSGYTEGSEEEYIRDQVPDEVVAKASSEAFAEQIDAGKSRLYASRYASQYGGAIHLGKSSAYAEAFASSRLCDIRTEEYDHAYAKQIGAGKSSTYAHNYARAYSSLHYRMPKYAQWIKAGNSSLTYAEAYAERIDAGRSSTYAEAYIERIDAGRSSTYAEAYAERIDAGKSGIYAHAYAEQIDAGRGPEDAEVYAERIDAGRPLLYAKSYAWVVGLIN